MRRQRQRPAPPGGANGYTLLEVIAVLAIVTILVMLVLGLTGMARRKASEGRARSDLARMADALQECWMKYGTYPTNYLFESAATNWLPSGSSSNDPWGQAYEYSFVNANAYRLFSCGPDTQSGTTDDITTGR